MSTPAKNLKVAVRIVKVLADLISKAVFSELDISDADFKAAMGDYDDAKKKLAKLDGDSGGGD